MWKITKGDQMPPMVKDESNVDCRRVDEVIPQNFRSEKWNSKPFNSFCIEPNEKEEFTSYKFEKKYPLFIDETTELPKGYANQSSEELYSGINTINQCKFDEGFLPELSQNEANKNNSFYDNPASFECKENFIEPATSFIDSDQAQSFRNQGAPTVKAEQRSDSLIFNKNAPYSSQKYNQARLGNSGLYYSDAENVYDYQENQRLVGSCLDDYTEEDQTFNYATHELVKIENNEVVPNFVLESSLPSQSSTNYSMENSSLSIETASALSAPSGIDQKAMTQGAPKSLPSYPFQTPTNGLHLQQISGYNLPGYHTNIQGYSHQTPPSQTSRDNPAIKFRIRTITQCEVECAPPNNLPLTNGPSQYLSNCPSQTQGQESNKELKNNDYTPAGSQLYLPNFNWNPSAADGAEKNNEKSANAAEILANQSLPLQQGYNNSFQNGFEHPRVLLHEQRQTSIVIGYPTAPNNNCSENFSNQSRNNFSDAQQTSSFTDPQSGNLFEPNRVNPGPEQDETLFNSETQYQGSIPNQNTQHDLNTSAVNQDVSWTKDETTATLNMQRDGSCDKVPSVGSFRPNHATFPASYTPVLEFSSHPFTCLPPNATWFSAKQTFTSFPPQNAAPFDYIVPPPSIKINGTDKMAAKTKNYMQMAKGKPDYQSKEEQTQSWISNDLSISKFERDNRHSNKKKGSTKVTSKDPKKYHCSEKNCSKKFSKEKELQIHVNKYHLNLLKPYMCAFCRKYFKRPDQLKRHEKIHTGEKPHPCSICGRLFARTDHRNTHYKKHNGIEKYDSVRKFTKSDMKNVEPKNGAHNYAENRTFEDGPNIFLPVKFTQVPGSNAWPSSYFVSHPRLYENQQNYFTENQQV